MPNGLGTLADVTEANGVKLEEQNHTSGSSAMCFRMCSNLCTLAWAAFFFAKGDGSSQEKIPWGPDAAVVCVHFFETTFKHFHEARGIRLKHPILGGKRLDMHRLFVEVLNRGGIDKVIKDRKWSEVVKLLNLPKSLTGASNALRQHYMRLLYDYEAYFIRREIQTQGRPENVPKRIYRKRQHRDPKLPKQNKSAYNYFLSEKYKLIHPQVNGETRNICKIIGQLWNNLPETEKKVYEEKALGDKERYKREKLAYKTSKEESSRRLPF